MPAEGEKAKREEAEGEKEVKRKSERELSGNQPRESMTINFVSVPTPQSGGNT